MSMKSEVAALFCQRDSIYKQFPNVEVYDIDSDARNYAGPWPVICHPPCRAWGALRHWAKPRPGEKNLAHFAMSTVRRFGGILEHPYISTLWDHYNIGKRPVIDQFGCFPLVVDQFWFGHKARKRTRLYICGLTPRELSVMPIALGDAPFTIGKWSGRDRTRQRPECSKRLKEATPLEFAAWLVENAAAVRINYHHAESF